MKKSIPGCSDGLHFFDDFLQHRHEVHSLQVQLHSPRIQLANLEQLFDKSDFSPDVSLDHLDRTNTVAIDAGTQKEGGAHDRGDGRAQFMSGHCDQLIFLFLRIERLNAVDGKTGQSGRDLDQTAIMFR